MLEPAPILVDHSHCGRHVTGLERITQELFSREALAPLAVTIVTAETRARMMLRQWASLPLAALRDRRALIVTPGFPPTPLLSLFGARVLPYIHDLFLITRQQDLNVRARCYMAPSFKLAVRRLPRFLVNSLHTGAELRRFCRADAEIVPYRPRVRNVFGVSDAGRAARGDAGDAPRLIALGTVEPRKNLIAAANILAALRARHFPGATLDVVGRIGWGDDAARLREMPGVTLHGYQQSDAVRALIDAADLYLTTAHDEGLGLPLLEVQYAGLPVVAPDKTVFREVLAETGLLLPQTAPENRADAITALLRAPGWRARHAASAAANLARWNAVADADKATVLTLLGKLTTIDAA